MGILPFEFSLIAIASKSNCTLKMEGLKVHMGFFFFRDIWWMEKLIQF